MALLAAVLCCGVSRGQPEQPTKYAAIVEARKPGIGGLLFSPDGKRLNYLVGGEDQIATWDVGAKRPLDHTRKPDARFYHLATSPDGRWLAAATLTKVFHVDPGPGERTLLYAHGDEKTRISTEVACVRYSRDGKRIVSADAHGVIKVWDVGKKAVAAEIRCFPDGGVLDLALIHGTDRALVTAYEATRDPEKRTNVLDHKVLLVDLKAGTVEPVTDRVSLGSIYAAIHHGTAVSPDGKLFASPGGKRFLVFSTATLKTEAELRCPVDPVVCLFSESGRLLVAGGSTKGVPDSRRPPGEVAVYDRASNTWVSHFRALDQAVTSMALSPKGDLLAVGSGKTGSEITVWDLSPVTRNLPQEKKESSPDNKRP